MSYSYVQTLLRISIAWSLLFSTPYGVPLAEPQPAHRQPAEVLEVGVGRLSEEKVESPYPTSEPSESIANQPKPGAIRVESPYCEANPEGGTKVKSSLFENTELSEAVKDWKEKAKSIYAKLAKARNGVLISEAHIQELPSVLSEIDPTLAELKVNVVAIVEKLPAAFGEDAKDLITNYFQIVALRIELEQFQNPMKWGLNDLRFQYALELSPKTERNLFVTGSFSLPGVDLDPIQRENRTAYRMALGADSTFHSLVRAAARSSQVGGKEKRYLETVRCILGRGILGKYAINKTILDRGNFGQPVDPNLNFCLGAKAGDFLELVSRDTDFSREMVLRANFMKSVPQIRFPQELQQFIIENDLEESLAQLVGFPELIDEVNVDRQQSGLTKIDVNRQFAMLLSVIDSLTNQEYKKFKAWEDMRLVWRQPSIQNLISSVFAGCGLRMVNLNDQKPVKFDYYWPRLMKSDDLMFLNHLATDISAIPGRWLEMDKAKLTQALREYIITKKVESSLRAFTFLAHRIADSSSADPKELIEVVYEDLNRAFTHEFNQIWDKNPELAKWLDGVVDKIQAERADSGNYQKMLTSFTEDLMKGAASVQKIMDPKRPVSTLPYVEKHVLGALGSSIKHLSPENRRRYVLLRDESDPVKRNTMWLGIEKLLKKETAAAGATCEGKPGFIDRTARTLGGWVGLNSAIRNKTANEDCHILTTVAMAIGADRTTPTSDLTYTINALQERIPDTVKDFIEAYRERLAISLTADQRLLMFPVKQDSMFNALSDLGVTPQGEVAVIEPDDEMLWKKIVRVNDAKKLEPDVLRGLKFSVADLGKYLKIVTEAKSEKDLMFFIMRTNVINAILGQDSIDQKGVLDRLNPVASGERVTRVLSNGDIGFVFPTLVQYHRELQAKYLRDEDFNREVWSEFYQANLNIVYWVIGGWAAKYALGVLPRFAGGPAVASLVDKAGGRLSGLIGGQADYVGLLMVANMGRAYLDKRDFETDLGRIRDMNTSEGVSLMAGSPFALLTEDQFIKQKLYFEEAIKNADEEIKSNLMWLAFPLLLGHGMKLFNTGLNHLRMGRNKRYESVGHSGRKSYEREFRASIYLRRNMLNNDLVRLGTQNIEVSALQAGRDAAILRASGSRQKFLAGESYDRVIIAFGRDIESLARMPHMQQSYANALYNGMGSVRNLEAIYKEYQRITRGSGI